MKSIFKSVIFIMLIFMFLNPIKGQLSLSYYGFKDHKVGLGYNVTKRFWSELKVYEANYLSIFGGDISLDNLVAAELSINFNYLTRNYYNCYFGINGFITEDAYYSGLGLLLGTEIFPFDSFKRLSFHLQIFPHFNDYEELKLTNEIGARFRFYDYNK